MTVFFPRHSVSLFHKIRCSHPLLSGYCLYFRTALATINWHNLYSTLKQRGNGRFHIVSTRNTCGVFVGNVFGRYLRHIVTSKQHLQLYIWVVPSLFQEATCSDLVFLRVLSFFEISTCNRLLSHRYWFNSTPVAPIHSTNGPFSIIKEQL